MNKCLTYKCLPLGSTTPLRLKYKTLKVSHAHFSFPFPVLLLLYIFTSTHTVNLTIRFYYSKINDFLRN